MSNVRRTNRVIRSVSDFLQLHGAIASANDSDCELSPDSSYEPMKRGSHGGDYHDSYRTGTCDPCGCTLSLLGETDLTSEIE